jgi:pilus assembly protein CpaB
VKRIRIIAVIAAVVTAIAVYVYLDSLKKPVEIARSQVMVALLEIKEGQKITEDMVIEKTIPTEAVVPGAFASRGDVVGMISSAKVEPGEQMLTTKCFKAGDANSALAFALDPGMRAFTIPVDAVTGVAGLIQPMDTVDILLIIGLAQGSLTPQDAQVMVVNSEILLQGIKVLAVDRNMQAGNTAADNPGTITLAVTPEQAVQLNLATSEGKIRLLLRSPQDTDRPDVKPVQPKDLVDLPDPTPTPKPSPSESPSESPMASPSAGG